MQVEYDENQVDSTSIQAAVQAAGYGIREATEADTINTHREDSTIRRRFLFSLVFMLPLVALHHCYQGEWASTAQLLLLIPIVWLNRSFFIKGTKAIIKGAPNMDSLITLGAVAGIIYSFVDMFILHTGVMYWESAGMILTLITFGKWLEARATGQTGQALEKLRALLPDTATLLQDEKATPIPAENIRKGDILLVRAGEYIPTDAIVINGCSAIDESALTGESIPVEKQEKSTVYAGTMNGNGTLKIQALHDRAHSSLSDIIRMVGEASAGKVPMARIADRISGIFVPIVVLLALITAIIWISGGHEVSTALGHAIAVLVVSCPCALGLATPVAIMVGAGKGAENGILFRNGATLEQARHITAVVLDKTGTITEGAPIVTDILPAPTTTKEKLLNVAAALEAESNHPLAEAIRQATQHLSPAPVQQLNYHPGLGVVAQLEGEKALAGNAEFMRLHNITVEEAAVSSLSATGKTPLFFALGHQFLGTIALQDPIKTNSAEAIHSMRELGIKRIIMMTGDNHQTAQTIAKQAGISDIFAGVKPEDKAIMVQQLRNEGHTVAMIGDGINDAPALTTANVGIAIGAGTDVAIESAGIILMRSELTDAVAAMQLSRAVIRNIRQNLFWAFFYNFITIPIAAGALIPLLGFAMTPGVAAAAMSLSSFCVVTNALRLRHLSLLQPIKPQTDMNTTITITVTGMMCPHCERHMNEAFQALPQVVSSKADHKNNAVTLELSAPLAEATIKEVVAQAGYTYGA